MRIVVDTNVLISGAFFSGTPSKMIDKCLDGEFQLVLSFEILDEYRRVGEAFSRQRPNKDFDRLLTLLITNAMVVQSCTLEEPVCRDPDDDKFIACAIATETNVIVSGDKDLLSVSGYADITVVRPKEFEERYL